VRDANGRAEDSHGADHMHLLVVTTTDRLRSSSNRAGQRRFNTSNHDTEVIPRHTPGRCTDTTGSDFDHLRRQELARIGANAISRTAAKTFRWSEGPTPAR
jgi:hypothetical protein